MVKITFFLQRISALIDDGQIACSTVKSGRLIFRFGTGVDERRIRDLPIEHRAGEDISHEQYRRRSSTAAFASNQAGMLVIAI